MKLVLLVAVCLLAFAAPPLAAATPIHPTACTDLVSASCGGLVCASPDASHVPYCVGGLP